MNIVDSNPDASLASPPFGYTFEGVRLELGRGRLLVDGIDTVAGPLVLRLLAVLCRSAGLLVLRQQLFDAVWPRQTVSDEALTKLIARLRETLGPYGRCLVTVRGRGLRLDASVIALDARDEPVPIAIPSRLAVPLDEAANGAMVDPYDDSAPMPQPSAHPAPIGRRVHVVVMLLVVLTTALVWWWTRGSSAWSPSTPTAALFSGFAVTEADLATAQPETIAMLHEASTAIDQGDIERGMVLLRVAHESDSSTAVPGALLAYFQARKLQPVDPDLHTEIAARLNTTATPYVRLLAQLSKDVVTRGDGGTPTMTAMVMMRPDAWRLQLRIAHQALGLRRPSQALAALQRMPLGGIPPDLIATALADRASLGDAKAVEAVVARDILASVPQEYDAMLRARLAWTAGQVDQAILLMDEAAARAVQSDNVRGELSARISAATFALYGRKADTDARLLQAAALIRRTTTLEAQLPEILALRAQLALDREDRQDAEDLLRTVARQHLATDFRLWLEVYNARLGVILPPGQFFGDLDRHTLDQLGQTSAYHLADAWVAFSQGNLIAARERLTAARSSGVDDTYLREDAVALEARLNGTQASCRPDPPYPNLLRFSTCRIEATAP